LAYSLDLVLRSVFSLENTVVVGSAPRKSAQESVPSTLSAHDVNPAGCTKHKHVIVKI
jgi:hypothetical protein